MIIGGRFLFIAFILVVAAFLIEPGKPDMLYNSPANIASSYYFDEENSNINYITDEESSYDISTDADKPFPKKCNDKDFFKCRLMREIINTHEFLYRNKNGLPYTKDPRNLTPVSELVRLNIDTQAHGYLNLYKITGKRNYLKEAESRLDYIISLGPDALSGGPFDGMIGYTFLSAYELTKNQTYYNYGMSIADKCITHEKHYNRLVLNWGYMCAMADAKAYKLTGNALYLNLTRNITLDTATYQFEDGSFPHFTQSGPNAGYTYWMIYELLQIRKDDPENPDIDSILVKVRGFLPKRVDSDGGLNYAEGNISYVDLTSDHDSRGWTNDLPAIAYNLKAFGDEEKAKLALTFLFSHQLNGTNQGSYPDKWAFPDPHFIWATGNPSVARTSLIFWYLTSIPLIDNSCHNGSVKSCKMTNKNCDSSFREFGLCNSGLTGENICIGGTFTECLNESLITYPKIPNCYSPFLLECNPDNPYCATLCFWTVSNKKCINGICTECFNTELIDVNECYTICNSTPYC